MSRRTSRSLLGVLAVTLAVGGSVYWLAHRRGVSIAPNTQASKPGVVQPVSLTALTPPATRPSVEKAVTAAHLSTPPTLLDTTTTPSEPVAPAPAPAPAKPGPAPVTATPVPVVVVDGPTSAHAVAEGKAKIDAGDLVGGRKILNDALIAGQLSPADNATAKQLISEANKTLIFSARQIPADPYGGSYKVPPGDLMQKIAFRNSLTADFLCRINGLTDARRLRAGATIKVLPGPFHAVVSKHAFTMDIYLGSPAEKNSMYVTTFPVGLGRDDSTPTGTWMVEQRIPNPKYYSPRGEGVIEAGDAKNPLGKFWIALTGTDGNAIGKMSYGIHGTIEPESIGKMSSMGCIRMRNEDVAVVYELLVAQKSIVVVKD